MSKMTNMGIDLNELLKLEGTESPFVSFENRVDFDRAVNREIFLGGIDEGTGSAIETLIRFWNDYDEKNDIPVEKRSPIKLYIDSPGGYLTETFTIIDAIELSKTPVWTICIGSAYSGGFLTFLAGHRRITYPRASFLFHEGATGTSGDAGKFRNYADFYNVQMEQLKDIVLKYTKYTEEDYMGFKKDDLWLTANQAIEHGVADEIATKLY